MSIVEKKSDSSSSTTSSTSNLSIFQKLTETKNYQHMKEVMREIWHATRTRKKRRERDQIVIQWCRLFALTCCALQDDRVRNTKDEYCEIELGSVEQTIDLLTTIEVLARTTEDTLETMSTEALELRKSNSRSKIGEKRRNIPSNEFNRISHLLRTSSYKKNGSTTTKVAVGYPKGIKRNTTPNNCMKIKDGFLIRFLMQCYRSPPYEKIDPVSKKSFLKFVLPILSKIDPTALEKKKMIEESIPDKENYYPQSETESETENNQEDKKEETNKVSDDLSVAENTTKRKLPPPIDKLIYNRNKTTPRRRFKRKRSAIQHKINEVAVTEKTAIENNVEDSKIADDTQIDNRDNKKQKSEDYVLKFDIHINTQHHISFKPVGENTVQVTFHKK